ncbi:thioredoxin [candidate division CSSED10-310 bacterium]|uniref:Thioredoxin n=1 Tax=candidate division CSSED10-310 bacterium TaxID=2855610 RepID=A0ABV6YV82_UNCC1
MAGDEKSTVMEFTDQNFQSDVLESTIPVIVDCWAPWCGPCLMIAPIIEEIAQENQGKLKVGKLNVDDNTKTAMAYAVRSIPTLLIFNEGKLIDQLIGAASKKSILKQLTKSVKLA